MHRKADRVRTPTISAVVVLEPAAVGARDSLAVQFEVAVATPTDDEWESVNHDVGGVAVIAYVLKMDYLFESGGRPCI
jgi:hypothetical protein